MLHLRTDGRIEPQGLSGVQQVDAKVNEQAAHVRYDPSQIKLEALIAAINKTGFKATQPSGEEG